MNTLQQNKLRLIGIFFLLGIFMISSPSLRISVYAADGEQGSSGGDSGGDSGGGSNDGDNGGGGSEDSGKEESSSNEESNGNSQEQEQKEEVKQEDKPDNDKPDDNGMTEIDREALKGTPEEQEKAAIEDYIYDEPGIVKPYPPVIKDKPPVKHLNPFKVGEGKGKDEDNNPCNYYGKNICEGSKDGKTCNDEKFDCLSEYKDANGKYQNCPTGQCPGDDKPTTPKQPPINDGKGDWCKSHPGECGQEGGKGENDWCMKHKDGCDNKRPEHPKHDWCKYHKCEHHGHGDHDHHHDHDHNYHNDHHYHNHNDNKYYYYYTNDYSNNHATVILQLDYHNSNSHDDIRLEIGNDFDTVINFAGEPEDMVVTGLDLDEGEHFDVCMENLDSDKVNCVKTQIYDEDKAVYVDIRVP